MKPLNGDDVPDGVVTVTVRSPSAEPEAIEIVTGSVVEVPPVPISAVTPEPLKAIRDAPVKPVPVITAPSVPP